MHCAAFWRSPRQEEIIRLLFGNFPDEPDQPSDAQLRDEPADRWDRVSLVSLL
jgi:hypothetical protein